MKPISMIVIGAGGRGTGYASYATEHPDEVRITGVAEPRDFYRNRIVERHGIPSENVTHDWKELAERERFADAAIIATQDAMHTEPAIAFARKGYHILLEKPMAPTEEECRTIAREAQSADIILAVCHVMRYTNYTQRLKRILDEGTIGEVISIEHLEPVAYWHQAHSFVRGSWRNSAESSSMLLAKSCHDLDWLKYMMGRKCRTVSSFGSLSHFRKSSKPKEAGGALRCTECTYEPQCPYSALKIYIGRVRSGHIGWPVSVLTPEPTEESVIEAIRTGPYGRCVYECDNDVVDHQLVNMELDGGATASFTMTAFNRASHRKTRIFGTRGSLDGDGDLRLMSSFIRAVGENNPRLIFSGPDESLETHLMVFAAERSRTNHTVEAVDSGA